MAIVQNVPCIKCQEMGHDSTGNHLMVFDDGNKLCNRSHFHKNGKPYFLPSGENDAITEMEITGDIRYTVEQFNEMLDAGKLSNETVRCLALAGMKMKDRYEVSTASEKAELEQQWHADMEWFDNLKTKSLVTRAIHGSIAKLYNVRVGHDADGKVNRHYYPQYDEGKLVAAKVRNLPKDFRGGLGKLFGKRDMWGMHTLKQVLDSGQTMKRLMITGGECDAMAAQEMLCKYNSTGKYEGRLYHVWSPNKGEACLQEIIDNKSDILRFQEVVLAFDNDEAGNALTKKVARILGSKALVLHLPAGMKDVNQCKMEGYSKAFNDAWWSAEPLKVSAVLKPLSAFRDKAVKTPNMGLSYPFPTMDKVTFGIREHFLSVWGAGSGVGKTKTTKQVLYHLTQELGESVVAIYLEEQPDKTLRSLAGMYSGKDYTAPPINDETDPLYEIQFDYEEEEATAAIDRMVEEGQVMLADLEGKKEVEAVMEVLEEAIALGYKHFIIDNLTAFEHKTKDGNSSTSAQAIDETMRALGTLKDEHPINIMLLSHLNRPEKGRTPHEEGGEVSMTDFRGSGSIVFWANAVWGIERNTKADSLHEKCITNYRNLKNRDVGFMTGTVVSTKMDIKTGHLEEINQTSNPSSDLNYDPESVSKEAPPFDPSEDEF